MKQLGLKKIFEFVSPLLISPKATSITISLSKRFFLFEMMRKIFQTIEDDPYLNFVSLLKNYKVLGKFLYGTVEEFHKDRNKLYFKKFFLEPELYELVKKDMEWLVKTHPQMRVTITKRGLLVYDNYKKDQFNVLLLTVHSGTWSPKNVREKIVLTKEGRFQEEDIHTDRLYSPLVLEKAGIWIDNKQSRFACDFNRSFENCIYEDNQEKWIETIWKTQLTPKEVRELKQGHREFYFTLARLTDTYRFNIIFDGHSMSHQPGRPNISFGTEYIPHFYMPIVRSMQRKMNRVGYSPVLLNVPYFGGYILQWLAKKSPDLFIFSAEINKRLYMNKDRTKVVDKHADQLSKDFVSIFDLQLEEDHEISLEEQ